MSLRHLGLAAMATAVLAFSAGCASITGDPHADDKEPPKPPAITANMELDKALEAGINFGGETLVDVKRLIKRKNVGIAAGKKIETTLRKQYDTLENAQLLNASNLYASMPVDISVPLFIDLISSAKPLPRQVGWQLAAMKPSKHLARAIDAELSRAVAENDEEPMLIPQMANAVAANHMKQLYTLVRQGLMLHGDEEYANAMRELDAKRASDDFLDYLALAPTDELRQLTMSSVNLYTCIAILRHMSSVPPSPGANNFDHLFDYAVSRNTGIADLAEGVIESYVPKRTDLMAQLLARHPAWVQIAFLDSARRRMDPKVGLLLTELRKTTAENDVIQEIDEIKF